MKRIVEIKHWKVLEEENLRYHRHTTFIIDAEEKVTKLRRPIEQKIDRGWWVKKYCMENYQRR